MTHSREQLQAQVLYLRREKATLPPDQSALLDRINKQELSLLLILRACKCRVCDREYDLLRTARLYIIEGYCSIQCQMLSAESLGFKRVKKGLLFNMSGITEQQVLQSAGLVGHEFILPQTKKENV